jgi:serine/threonine-protein kinase
MDAVPRRVDPEVYLLNLRGRHFWHQRTETGFRSALRLFEDAAARDPTYAPAHVGIAESLNMLANYGLIPPQEIRPRSLAAARRALELDAASAEAHRLLAFVHWQFAFEWEEAFAEYERSLELNPHSPGTTYWFGIYLAVIGFFDRAHQLLNRARELDPLSLVVPSVQGWTHIFARQFEDALPYLEQVLRIDPSFHLALWFQGEALVELQRYDEGITSLTRAYELGGRTSRLLGYLGYAYGAQLERQGSGEGSRGPRGRHHPGGSVARARLRLHRHQRHDRARASGAAGRRHVAAFRSRARGDGRSGVQLALSGYERSVGGRQSGRDPNRSGTRASAQISQHKRVLRVFVISWLHLV